MRKSILLIAGALIASQGLVSTIKAEVLDYTSSEPSKGEVTEMGSLRIYYKSVPVPNPDCTEPAVLAHNGEILMEIPSTSSSIQRFIMQADNCYTILFFSKKVTDPGTYTVHIPAGFMTFNDGADTSAEVNMEFVIPEPVKFTVDPPTGYITSMPREITVTYEGVTEIVDNHSPMGADDVGCIKFDSPDWYVLPIVEINGNTITFKCYSENVPPTPDVPDQPEEAPRRHLVADGDVSTEDYTSPGKYMLAIWPKNLTFTMDDGSKRNPTYTELIWWLPNIERPDIEPAEGEVNSLSSFTLTLHGDDKFAIFNNRPALYAIDENGVESSTPVATAARTRSGIVRQFDTNSLEFKFNNEVKEPGKYILKMNKSFFSIQGPENTMATDIWNCAPYEYYFTVHSEGVGVETVSPETDNCGTLYNMAGIPVAQNITADHIKDFPAGLYIFNGKKILVK